MDGYPGFGSRHLDGKIGSLDFEDRPQIKACKILHAARVFGESSGFPIF